MTGVTMIKDHEFPFILRDAQGTYINAFETKDGALLYASALSKFDDRFDLHLPLVVTENA